jgi:hypothetical protein
MSALVEERVRHPTGGARGRGRRAGHDGLAAEPAEPRRAASLLPGPEEGLGAARSRRTCRTKRAQSSDSEPRRRSSTTSLATSRSSSARVFSAALTKFSRARPASASSTRRRSRRPATRCGANGNLAQNILIWAEGFANAANNGLKALGAGSITTEIKAAGLVVEASPPVGCGGVRRRRPGRRDRHRDERRLAADVGREHLDHARARGRHVDLGRRRHCGRARRIRVRDGGRSRLRTNHGDRRRRAHGRPSKPSVVGRHRHG